MGTCSIFENEVENSFFHIFLGKPGDHSILLKKVYLGLFHWLFSSVTLVQVIDAYRCGEK